MNEMSLRQSDRLSSSAPNRVASLYADTGKASDASGKELPETQAKAEVAPPEREKVEEAVSRMKEYVQQTERSLDFQLDEDSGKTIIRVYDKQSSELIRQIPSELALELAQKLNDEEPSLLFSAQV
jgi:flagellar protein FlaG